MLVGLGNPGEKYTNNRHNIGFQIIDFIISKILKINITEINSLSTYNLINEHFEYKFSGQMCLTSMKAINPSNKYNNTEDSKIILFKPTSYMNLSGQPIRNLQLFYKIKHENLYVFHDDIDLTLCKIKIKNGGSNGGHNGLKSIDACIGQNYNRVRFGVGRPEYSSMVADYVLHDFHKEERHKVIHTLNLISSNIQTLLSHNWQSFLRETFL